MVTSLLFYITMDKVLPWLSVMGLVVPPLLHTVKSIMMKPIYANNLQNALFKSFDVE